MMTGLILNDEAYKLMGICMEVNTEVVKRIVSKMNSCRSYLKFVSFYERD